jgi:hypothetical protein
MALRVPSIVCREQPVCILGHDGASGGRTQQGHNRQAFVHEELKVALGLGQRQGVPQGHQGSGDVASLL